jgi:predicted kinase
MKTPMQEAIDKIKQISNNENITGFSKRAYSVCLDVLEPILEKEKKMIIDAYNNGQQIPPFKYAEHYYNEKINNNERT